jgi:subtilisin-like proprotein convertase family protein
MPYSRSATRWPARMLALASISAAALLFAAGPASAADFQNASPITIKDATATAVGTASVYPSDIPVNVTGAVSKVTVDVKGFTHSCSLDVDMLLVGPAGQRSILMSDGGDCAGTATAHPASNITFDDAAATGVPCLDTSKATPDPVFAGGTFKPTDWDDTATHQCTPGNDDTHTSADIFPQQTGPFPTGLTAMNGTAVNGIWHLYVVDQYQGDSGSITGGWALHFTVPAPTVTAPGISGVAQIGTTLSAAAGNIGGGGGNPSFQWQRCDLTGKTCTAIPGATGITYAVQAADKGQAIVLTETVTNSGGAVSANSAPTGAVVDGPGLQQPNVAAKVSSRKTKSVQKVLSQGGVLAAFTSSANGNLVASGTVSVPNLAKTYKFTVVRSKVVAGNPTTVRLKLSRKALKAIKKALGKHKKLSAKITLVVTTPSGAKTTVHKTIKFKR